MLLEMSDVAAAKPDGVSDIPIAKEVPEGDGRKLVNLCFILFRAGESDWIYEKERDLIPDVLERLQNNNKDYNGYCIKNNSIGNLSSNLIDNINITDILNSPKHKEKNTNDPLILHNIFHNTINHILSVRPFFIPLNNIPLKKMELDFLEKDLTKSGNNLYILLEGCLDCVNELQ